MADSFQRVRVALFGLGRIGQIHLPNILANPRAELVWVVEYSRELAVTSLTSLGVEKDVNVAGLEDIDKVLADDTIAAVFICTPTDSHAELSIRALKAGKHVFCEKPISEKTSLIKECYDTAEQYNKTLMAAFNRKFDASYRDIYRRVRAGELGDIYMVRSTMRDSPLWLGANSLSQTFLCHEIDQLCWMADDLPDTVVTVGASHIKEIQEKDDLDNVVVTMKFPSGTIGVLDFCRYSCYGYDIRLEVFGSKGMLKLELPTPTSVHTYSASGVMQPPLNVSFFDRFAKAYVAEVNHFIDVVQGGEELFVPRVQCERAAVVRDAIEESYKTGQVVKLKK